MFGLVVRFELLVGQEAAFDDLVAQTLELIQAEESDTLAYETYTVGDSPSSRVFVELYRDEEAFQAHERADHSRRFLEQRRRHLHSDPQVWFISPQIGFVRDEVTGDG